MSESRIPVCENAKGPSSLRHIHRELGIHLCREILRRAHDGEFVGGVGDRREAALCGPVGDTCPWRKADDGVEAWELAELEVMAFRVILFTVRVSHEEAKTNNRFLGSPSLWLALSDKFPKITEAAPI
jgi:hypothetical protein